MERLLAIFRSRRNNTRAIGLVTVISICLGLLGTAAAGYNNRDMPCGTWPNANPIRIWWKWGPDITPSGSWGYAFATVAEPNWDNSLTKFELSYASDAEASLDVYYDSGTTAYGQAFVWCHWFTTQIAHFNAEGNTFYNPQTSPYNSYMGNVAGHEIGHGLGLGHSTAPAGAVMVQGYTGSWPTSDDYAGIASLYP